MREYYYSHYRNLDLNCEGLHLFSSQSKVSWHYIHPFTCSECIVHCPSSTCEQPALQQQIGPYSYLHNWKCSLKISSAEKSGGPKKKVKQQCLFNDAFILQDTNLSTQQELKCLIFTILHPPYDQIYIYYRTYIQYLQIFYICIFFDHKNDHLHLHNLQRHLYFTLIFFTVLQNQNKFTPLPNISIFTKKKKKSVLSIKTRNVFIIKGNCSAWPIIMLSNPTADPGPTKITVLICLEG